MIDALLYEKLPHNRVRCQLCAHQCVISEGRLGVCNVRENIEGNLYSLVYGRTISQHADPVEKKPLYHFLPGSTAYSIATPGCNFHCPWCQNWQISQMPREQDFINGRQCRPEEIVSLAILSGSQSIAYTYTEPTIFFEYAFEIARLAHAAGLMNIFVTNGYMSRLMLETMHPYLDAANVDLKCFSKTLYRTTIEGGLQPVLDNLILMKRLGIWLEITTLVIPGLNDDPDELRQAAEFIVQNLGKDTPWHLSRFFPAYKMIDRPPTPLPTLARAREIGRQAGLRYIYVGNVVEEPDTICPGCGEMLVRRRGYRILENRVHYGRCSECGEPVAGLWADLRHLVPT